MSDHKPIVTMINRVLETMYAKMVSGRFRFSDDIGTLQRQAEIADSINQPILRAWVLTSIGGAYTFAGKFEQAEQWFCEALHICQSHHDAKHTASSLNNLGELQRMSGKFDEALDFYQQALSLCDNADTTTDSTSTDITLVGMRSTLYQNMGNVYMALHHLEEAERMLNTAYALFVEATRTDQSLAQVSAGIEINRTRAEVALHKGDLPRAWSLIALAEEAAQRQDHYIYLADIALTKAHLAGCDPDYQVPSIFYYQAAREFIRRLGHDTYLARFLLAEAQYQSQTGVVELAHLYASEAYALCHALNMREEALFAQALLR